MGGLSRSFSPYWTAT